MASAIGRRLTLAHKQAQARLAQATVAEMSSIWRLLDGGRLDATFPRWLTAAMPVVADGRSRSADLATSYLSTFRLTETGQRGTVERVDEVDDKALATSLLVTGPVSVKAAMRRGVPLARALSAAEASSAAAASRYVLDAGRDTVLATLSSDDRAQGWERVASANSCSFCQLLAGRGAVYSVESADFASHDGCACGAEPVYR